MKPVWFALFTAFAANAWIPVEPAWPAADAYRDYADLAAHEREGTDYRVAVTDRGSAQTVLAIHGGWIERGTSELAGAIAGRARWNLYLFEADRMALHLTSTHFDEPRAVALVGRSSRVLSLHGFYQGEDHASIVCVGGGDATGAAEIARVLRLSATELAISVEFPCARFSGIEPLNIVNRARSGGGVQLEFSRPLRERLRGSSEFLGRFAAIFGT